MTPSTFRADVLSGKRILITGGGTGLGKELARHFVAHGASVHICGRREAVLQAAVTELQAAALHGGTIEHHICDVRDADQIEAMVERIWAGGALTGLINNAAARLGRCIPAGCILPGASASSRNSIFSPLYDIGR